MAADFGSTGTRNLSASSPVTAVPLTMACWFNTAADSTQKTIISAGIANAVHRCLIQINTTNQLQAFTVGTISVSSTFTTAITGNVWNHACGVFAATNSRTVYLNGSAATPNNSSSTQDSFNDIRIGARWNGSLGVHMRGLIADVGIWNVALDANEIASLADGINCSKIRPESLVFYCPLIREFIDIVGGLTITNNNSTTVANHPRIYY